MLGGDEIVSVIGPDRRWPGSSKTCRQNIPDRSPLSCCGPVEQIKKAGRRAIAIPADSTDPAAVTAAVDRVAGELGRLDILVNNAGAFLLGPLDQLQLEEFEQSIAVNVRAPFVASQAAVRHLPAGGRIINIGSNVAFLASTDGRYITGATVNVDGGFTI